MTATLNCLQGACVHLSVVIVSHNVRPLLQDCLKSLFESLIGIEAEVFVVDNCSNDGSAWVVENQFPRAKLICNKHNAGYAAANNLAIKQTAGEYVLLLNPDTFIPCGAIDEMLDFMEAHPDVGVAGPRLTLGDGSLDPACRRSFPAPDVAFYRLFGLNRLFPNSKRFGSYNLTHLDENQDSEVDCVSGAFMMMRRRALDQVGALDETYFMYGEDLDLAYRIKEIGWRVYYHPKAWVVHYKGQSSKQTSYRSTLEFYRAMRIFYDKHYASSHSGLFNSVVAVGIALRGAVSLGKNLLRPGRTKRVAT